MAREPETDTEAKVVATVDGRAVAALGGTQAMTVALRKVNPQKHHRMVEKATGRDGMHVFPEENGVVPALDVHGNGGVGVGAVSPQDRIVCVAE